MRYILGIVFVLFFTGFLVFTGKLGGPPFESYEPRNLLVGGALACAALSAIPLGLLALGVGARGKKISSWRVPLLCGVPLLLCILFVVLMLASGAPPTPKHAELGLRMLVSIFTMALISLAGLIVTLIRSRKHNSSVAPTATYQPGLWQSSGQANIKRCPACGNTYTDVTQSFCLADGSSLEHATDPYVPYDTEATVTLNKK